MKKPIVPIHVCRNLVPSHQVISQRGDRCASMTQDGCLHEDSVAHRLQKVPVTDGNGCPGPSPGCPLPWSPEIHKSAAGITADLVHYFLEVALKAAMVNASRAWKYPHTRCMTRLKCVIKVSIESTVSTSMRSCHSPR